MINELMTEKLPQKIIEENRQREQKFNFYKAVLLDIFFVFYSILVLQRAIYYKFFVDLRDLPFSWVGNPDNFYHQCCNRYFMDNDAYIPFMQTVRYCSRQ